jgi:dipeptidyl-peptidase-4
MRKCRAVAVLGVMGGLMTEATVRAQPEAPGPGQRAVDAAMVARLPAPGTVVPGAIAFTPDGKALSYLKSETPDSLSRVLWRMDLPDGEPRVVARPPGAGDTDANVSREEALRRERQRLRDTGITQVARAEKADVTAFPLAGDVFLQRGAGQLDRLTTTPAPEIDPKPSADGSKVAYVRGGELFVLDVASRQETQLTSGAEEGLTHGLAEYIAQEELNRFSGYWWSPDGARIAYEEVDERAVPLYTIVHQGGEEYSTETHRYPFAGAANARVRLGVVPVTGGATRWLTLAEPDEEVYLARVEWDGPKSLLVQVLSRDQKRLRLLRLDVSEDRRTTLIEETSDSWIDLHDDLRVVPETGEILWSSERSGLAQLELRDRDGKLVRTLTAEPWPVDGVVRLDAKRREVWFTGGGPIEMHLYRVSLDGGAVHRMTPEHGVHRAVVAPHGDRIVDVAMSLDRPPLTTLRNRDGEVIRILDDASKDPRIVEATLAKPQLLSFRNRDGVELHGAFYAPRTGAMGTPAPLVVMVYGGPTVQTVTDSWGLTADMTAQFLADRGFAVWKCDNRGSSRRGRAFQAPIHHRLGTVEVEDQADGVRFITSARRQELDPSRVGITGGSYGGYMTLRALELAPDVFKAGVAVAPVTDWAGYDTAYTERYMGTPRENPEGYRYASVLTQAEKLAGELMVIHGMLDENVHFRHTARFATAMIRAAKPFQLLALPDERHSSRRPEDRKYVAERTAAFFEEALRPRQP